MSPNFGSPPVPFSSRRIAETHLGEWERLLRRVPGRPRPPGPSRLQPKPGLHAQLLQIARRLRWRPRDQVKLLSPRGGHQTGRGSRRRGA
eukprot:1457157-Pyramimonas_sp.AAC.1